MLESVVQENDFGTVGEGKQFACAVHAVFVRRDQNFLKLSEILQRLVADGLVSALIVSYLEAFCLSTIASTQSRHFVFVTQYINKVLHRGRFSGSTKAEVAHTNHGLLESRLFQNPPIVKFVPDFQHDMVQ